MNRRNFIKAASCGALLTGALPSVSHAAAENRPPIPGSLGMLYDSTLCVGCQACVTKCQDINFPERNPQGEQTGRTTTNCRRIPITLFRCGPAARVSTKTRKRTATRTLRNSVCTASIELCLRVSGLCAEKRSENRHCPLRQRCVHWLPLLHGRLPIQRAEVRLQQPIWCAA